MHRTQTPVSSRHPPPQAKPVQHAHMQSLAGASSPHRPSLRCYAEGAPKVGTAIASPTACLGRRPSALTSTCATFAHACAMHQPPSRHGRPALRPARLASLPVPALHAAGHCVWPGSHTAWTPPSPRPPRCRALRLARLAHCLGPSQSPPSTLQGTVFGPARTLLGALPIPSLNVAGRCVRPGPHAPSPGHAPRPAGGGRRGPDCHRDGG